MPSDDDKSEIQNAKTARHQAEIHQDITRLRTHAKKYGTEAAKMEHKSLSEEEKVNNYTKKAVVSRERAKAAYTEASVYAKKGDELRKELKAKNGKLPFFKHIYYNIICKILIWLPSKPIQFDRKAAKLREIARRRDSRAAKYNETAAEHKIKAKTYKQKAKEAEHEHDSYMGRADLLEKVTD